MFNSAAILKVDARLLVVPLGPRRECRGGQRATRGKNIIYYSINSTWVSRITPVLHLWMRCYWPVVTRGISRLQGPTRFWWIAPRRFRPSKDKKPQKRGNNREHHNSAHGTAHDRWSIGLRRRPRWWWWPLRGCWRPGGRLGSSICRLVDRGFKEPLNVDVLPAGCGAVVLGIRYKPRDHLWRSISARGIVVRPLFSIELSISPYGGKIGGNRALPTLSASRS